MSDRPEFEFVNDYRPPPRRRRPDRTGVTVLAWAGGLMGLLVLLLVILVFAGCAGLWVLFWTGGGRIC